jgi:hypothetical protein
MNVRQVNKQKFHKIIKRIEYREDDIKEAKEFGCKDIEDCYIKPNMKYARYYVIYEDRKPIVTVALLRNGQIIFFISKNVKRKKLLIKTLRKFAKRTVKCAGPITTKTANWYTEALRLNELVGFDLAYINNRYQIWVFGDEELKQLGRA